MEQVTIDKSEMEQVTIDKSGMEQVTIDKFETEQVTIDTEFLERFQWNDFIMYAKFQIVSCLGHSHFFNAVFKSLSIEWNDHGENSIWYWKILQKSLNLMS